MVYICIRIKYNEKNVDLKTKSLKRIIAQGTSNGENKTFRRHSK